MELSVFLDYGLTSLFQWLFPTLLLIFIQPCCQTCCCGQFHTCSPLFTANSVLMCLRGSRSSSGSPGVPVVVDLIVAEGHRTTSSD